MIFAVIRILIYSNESVFDGVKPDRSARYTFTATQAASTAHDQVNLDHLKHFSLSVRTSDSDGVFTNISDLISPPSSTCTVKFDKSSAMSRFNTHLDLSLNWRNKVYLSFRFHRSALNSLTTLRIFQVIDMCYTPISLRWW